MDFKLFFKEKAITILLLLFGIIDRKSVGRERVSYEV